MFICLFVCLFVYCRKFPGSTNALSVYVTPDSELGEPVFTSSDIMGGSWREVRLTIPADGEFRVRAVR